MEKWHRTGETKYVRASEMARRWGLSVRRVRHLCATLRVFKARHDKDTGEWLIPETAERPTDGRAYRYKKVPTHLQALVQHVDVGVAAAKAHPKRTPEDGWLYFVRGSAFHLHTLKRSSLRFCDVCDILNGRMDGTWDVRDREKVLIHVKTLEYVRQAVQDGRRLTMTLVREIARSANGGRRARCESEGSSLVLAEKIRLLAQAETHPLVKAGEALERIFWLHPYAHLSEIVGYMLANFILMRAGYPPMILYRAIFKAAARYDRIHRLIVRDFQEFGHYGDRVLANPPPAPVKHHAFLCACVIRAVLRSCRFGIPAVM